MQGGSEHAGQGARRRWHRRQTLRWLGGAVLAGAALPLLSACGQSSSGTASTSASGATPATTSAASATSAPTSSAPAGASSSGGTSSLAASTGSGSASSAAGTGSATSSGSLSNTAASSAVSSTTASSSGSASAAAAAPPTKLGTLNLFVGKINSPPGAQDKLLASLIDQFQKQYAGVKVAFGTYASAAEETTKIETSAASGSGPDIFEFGSTVVPTAAATNSFIVITDSMWQTLGGKDKFFAAQLKMSGLSDSTPIAIPEYMLPFTLVYNTELLQTAGAKPPTTWTEFVDAAKKMTDSTKDQWGTVMDPSDPFDPWHILWLLAKQYGGDFITEDMTKATMTSEPVYNAFRFWFDWMSNFKIVKLADATFKGVDQLNAFASGKIGFLVMQGPTSIPTLDSSNVKGKYAFTPMPTIPFNMTSLPQGGVPVQTFVSGQYLTVAKFSKLQDDAIVWIKYVTDVPQQIQFLKTYGYMPAITAAYQQPELQTPVWKAFVDAENHAYATPLTGAWGPIETIVGGVASKIAAEYATNSFKTDDLKNSLAAVNSQVQQTLDAQKK